MFLVLGLQSWVLLSSTKFQNLEVKLLPLKMLPVPALAVGWISLLMLTSLGAAAPGWRELLPVWKSLSCVGLQLLND